MRLYQGMETQVKLVSAILLAATITGTHAAEYPSKPLTILVPAVVGSRTDGVARMFAEQLLRNLKPPTIILENNGETSGRLLALKTLAAPADGYTLLVQSLQIATTPTIYRKPPYKALDDFEYLGLVAQFPMVIVATATIPASSLTELRKWLATPKRVATIAHTGLGSASHICGLMLQQGLNVPMTFTLVNGSQQGVLAVLRGQADLMCVQAADLDRSLLEPSKPHGPCKIEPSREGRLYEDCFIRAYATTTPVRLAAPDYLKNLPTMVESGFKGFTVTNWYALYAKKGTPRIALAKLEDAIRQTIQSPVFMQRLGTVGAMAITNSRTNAVDHKSFVAAEVARLAPAIKAGGQFAD